jgi:hypothetical protein
MTSVVSPFHITILCLISRYHLLDNQPTETFITTKGMRAVSLLFSLPMAL